MITVLYRFVQQVEKGFTTHPNLLIFFLIASYFRPFGLSSFHTFWPLEALGNAWGLIAFLLTMVLCYVTRLYLGRSWWLIAAVCAITACSTLLSAVFHPQSISWHEALSTSNIIDVLGMTGQALGLAAAVCLCATKTSWYRTFCVLFYLLAAVLIINTALLVVAPQGLLSMSFVGQWHRGDSPILFIGNRNFLYLWHLPLLASTCALDALRNLRPCHQMASIHTDNQQIAALMRLLDSPIPPANLFTKLYAGVSLRTVITAVAGLSALYVAGSQTSLGALALFTPLSLGILVYHAKAHQIFPIVCTKLWDLLSNPWVHLGSYLAVSGGFVLFRLQNHQPFVFLINNIMGRSTTLTYRTEIWDATMNLVSTPWYALFIGHGHLSGQGMANFFITHGYQDGYHVTEWVHVHNDLLQTLFSAGWIGLICTVAAFVLAIHAFKRTRQLAFMAIIGATVCAFMVVMITETFMGSPVVTFVVIGSYLFTKSARAGTLH